MRTSAPSISGADAELLEARETLVPQDAVAKNLCADGRRKGPQHEKGFARQIADATGLSDDSLVAEAPLPTNAKLIRVLAV